MLGRSICSEGFFDDDTLRQKATAMATIARPMKMVSALTAADASETEGSAEAFLKMFPTKIGTSNIPMFWIQYIREYAVPSDFSGTILGTEGHMAEGTRE